MHDDPALTVGRVTRVLGERIRPAIHSLTVPLEVARHELPGEPIPPADGLALDFTADTAGTPWGPAWSTTWFRVRGRVPEEWRGRRVEVVVDLGFDINMPGFQCEALVYRPDGTPVKSLNPRNQWIPVTAEAAGGEQLELFLEAAANPVLLDYHPFLPTRQGDILTSSPDPLYRSRRFDLAVFEEEVFELSLDLEVLLELQAELPATGPRRLRILQALDDALDVLDLQRIAETAPDARARLADVLASPAEASAHRIAAIGHAHIDSAWLWPVRETIRKVARTASSMTELLDADPDFRYGMSSAQQYEWLKLHRPEVYARVKAAVAEGRFLPLGGMWVESDTVMPTGESIVRQFAYGQRFFQEEFGIRSRGVWLPDSFGYSPALPQLMRRAGFEWFFTQKISWNQANVFPHHTFLWEGIDGSRMFTHFPPMDTYNSRLSGEEVAKATRQFKENRVATRSIAPVGWGDGGGGTTREMAAKARRLADLEGSARVAWTHPDDFFREAAAELPHPAVWVGELYLELHRGTLTSQHATKAGNRRAEHALVEAELWSATAAVRLGRAYPDHELDALWKSLLLHQFHDILPGTSIAWVHREAAAELARVAAAAQRLAQEARAALAGSGTRELEFDPATGAALVVDAAPPIAAGTVTAVDGGWELANDAVVIRLSAEGLVVSAVDRATGRDAVPAGRPAALLQLHQDFPNMWDAWDIDRFYRNIVSDVREVVAIDATVVDGIPTVTVDRAFSHSTVRQTFRLVDRALHLELDVDWHETEKLLKLAFPLDIAATHTEAETQFGYQARVTHVNTSWEAAKFETSMHRFVLVREPGFGVALLNDSLYGYDTTRDSTPEEGVTTTVRLSLLRAPRFPDPETDQGRHRIAVALLVGADPVSATAAGAELNAPRTRTAGAAPVEPLVRVEGEGLRLSSVKLAADGSGDVIVRLYEAAGRRAAGTLHVDFPHTSVDPVTLLEEPLGEAPALPAPVSLSLTPFEVRTYRIRR
ncbi:alpha-mannosidase [Leifsonia sp. ku-ls]|nr:alpha-mannosidase [Leifsonia sp. ku-ls]